MSPLSSSVFEVQQHDDRLVTSSGAALLEGMAREVRVRLEGTAAVLGLNAPGGEPVAAAERCLGKVGAAWIGRHVQLSCHACRFPSAWGMHRCKTTSAAPLMSPTHVLPQRPVTPQLKASRFLALGRTSLWWMTPAWGSSTQQVGCRLARACQVERPPCQCTHALPINQTPQIPEETQCLLVELEGGAGYALLLPLIDGGTFRATLRPAK